MRRVCSICNQKEPLLFGKLRICQVNGVCYCQDCYPKVFGDPEIHPIPDSLLKGLSGAGIEILSDDEFAFWDQSFPKKVRIHRFMHYPLHDFRAFTPGSFLGLDLYSGSPVWVDYSEDETSSDGGPSYVTIHKHSAREFSNLLSHFPKCISEKFSGFSQETWQDFRDFKVDLDLSVVSYNLMHEQGDIVKVLRYSSQGGFIYAELRKEVFHAWREGKDPVLCAVTIPSLKEKADFYIANPLIPLLMKKWKQLLAYLKECCDCGYRVPADQANMIHIQRNCKQLDTCCVPPDKIQQVFSQLESIFPEKFENRINCSVPPKNNFVK